MTVEIVGRITGIDTIAVGKSIHEVERLVKIYGDGRWRKLKGTAQIQLKDGTVCMAEIHWYKAHGIGEKRI